MYFEHCSTFEVRKNQNNFYGRPIKLTSRMGPIRYGYLTIYVVLILEVPRYVNKYILPTLACCYNSANCSQWLIHRALVANTLKVSVKIVLAAGSMRHQQPVGIIHLGVVKNILEHSQTSQRMITCRNSASRDMEVDSRASGNCSCCCNRWSW